MYVAINKDGSIWGGGRCSVAINKDDSNTNSILGPV
jgi:hypothetical protein